MPLKVQQNFLPKSTVMPLREFIAENLAEYLTSPFTAKETFKRVWNIHIVPVTPNELLEKE